MKRLLTYFLISILTVFSSIFAQEKQADRAKTIVYQFDINEEIGTAIWRKMQNF